MEVPDSLVSGQDTNITLLVRNTGKTTWSSSDDNPARLLVRWFDSNSGQRFRWEIKWLPGSIAPGQTLPMPLVLTPPRAGKLRLNLVITRLPGGKYQPASNQSDDNLIKLAEKDLRVTVK